MSSTLWFLWLESSVLGVFLDGSGLFHIVVVDSGLTGGLIFRDIS